MAKRSNRQTADPAKPVAGGRGPRILVFVALIGLALLVANNLAVAVSVVRYPVDVNFGEGVVQAEALRIARGLPIYKPVDAEPWWIGTYPPLVQAIGALGGGSLAWLRIVALASTLAGALALGMIAWRRGGSRIGAVLASGAWLASPYVGLWGALARVDLPGRALESLAVAAVALWPARRRAVAAAVVLATLAMLCKQTMVAGGLACAAVLWFDAGRKRACVFLAAWTAAVAACYLSLNWATGGMFFDNAFGRVTRPFSPAFLFVWFRDFGVTHGALVLASLVSLPLLWPNGAGRVFLLAGAAGIPAALLSGNDGADLNYYFDLVWGACGAAGIAGGLAAGTAWPPGRKWAAPALVAVYAAALLPFPLPVATAREAERSREIVARLAVRPKPVLCEFVSYGLAAGSDPEFLPYMFTKLEEGGQWNSAPLVRRVAEKHYGAILVTNQVAARWPRRVVEAMTQSYEPVAEFADTYIVDGEHTQVLLVPK